MATAWDIASVGWSMIVLGWLVSPIITFLLPKIISYLGFEFHTSEKLLDLEFHIIPELEKTLRAVDQERMLGRGKKVPGVVASLDKLAAMMRHAREDAEDIFDDEQEIKLYRNRFCHRLYRVAATCIARFKSSSISIASIIRSRLAWSFQWAWMNSLRLLHHALKWIGRSVWCGSCWLLHWAWKIFLPRQQSVLPVTSTTIVLTTSVAPSDGPLRVATNAATLDEPVPKTAPMDSWFGSSNCSEGAASDEPVLVTASDAAGDELIIDTTLSDLELISTFNSEGEVSHEPGTALPDSSRWCSSFDFFNSCFWSTCTGIVDAFEVACTYRNWSYDMVGIRNNQEVCEPEIPTHLEMLLEKVTLVEKENKYLKEKLKIIEDKNMEMELHVAEVIDDRKMKIDAMRLKMDAMRLKMDEMRLKIRNIRKYAIDKEAWYHSALGSIVALLAILIAFVVAFKCFT